MTLVGHWELVCDGGFMERCVRSPECVGYLVLEDGKRDVHGQAKAAGWAWVVQGYGDVQLCPACLGANRARYGARA